MHSVESLGKEEEALSRRMPSCGYIEERDEYLKTHDLYDAWKQIYIDYVGLAAEGDLEALKRALFYAWYQLSEPSWLSGIPALPDSQTKIVVDLLEESLEQGLQDKELQFMLPYYMIVCCYYLERFYPLPNVEKLSRKESDSSRILASKSSWSNRGQMDDYWG